MQKSKTGCHKGTLPCRHGGKSAKCIVLLKRGAMLVKNLQSTPVISNSKGLPEILRDIRISTYQICRIQEKLIRLTTFHKYMCNWTLESRDILKILWKRGEIAP